MPFFQFALNVEAIKLVPEARYASNFLLQWYYSDDSQGSALPSSRSGDELGFNMHAKFVAEQQGTITRLLQLTVIEESPRGEKNLAGVLMIDLNAHLPRGHRISKQRATLNMSRCPYARPLIIRLGIECTQMRGPSTAVRPSPSSAFTESRQNTHSTPRVQQEPSPVPFLQNDETHQHPGAPRATVAALTATNEQLREENMKLREEIARATHEAAYTYSAVKTTPAKDNETLRLQAEIRTLRAEIAVLQKSLQSAKTQLHMAQEREADLEREVTRVNRTNDFQSDDISRLETDLENLRHRFALAADLTTSNPSEAISLRDTLAASQQMVRDLRAMLNSAEASNAGMQKQLETATRAQQEAEAQKRAAMDSYSLRATEAEAKAARYEEALRAGQLELNRMHDYCKDCNQRCQQFVKAWEAQRTLAEERKLKLRDVKNILRAQQTAAKVTGLVDDDIL